MGKYQKLLLISLLALFGKVRGQEVFNAYPPGSYSSPEGGRRGLVLSHRLSPTPRLVGLKVRGEGEYLETAEGRNIRISSQAPLTYATQPQAYYPRAGASFQAPISYAYVQPGEPLPRPQKRIRVATAAAASPSSVSTPYAYAQSHSPAQYRAQSQPLYATQYAVQPQQQSLSYAAQPQPQIYAQQPKIYAQQPQQYYVPQQQKLVASAAPQPLRVHQLPVKVSRPKLQKQVAKTEEELEEEYPSDPNPQYNFAFDVKDDDFTNYQNRQETRDKGVTKGSYSVVDPDGYVRTVTYEASKTGGFQAKVTREPTDVKIKFPVPTPAPKEGEQPGVQQYAYAPQQQGYVPRGRFRLANPQYAQ